MFNKKIKHLSLFLVGIMTAGALVGCSEKKEIVKTNNTKNESNELSSEPITLTYWYPLWPNEAELVQSLGDNEAYKKISEITNVTIEYIHPPVADTAQVFNTMLASRNLPDIITHDYYVDYPGGADKAIEDGVYLRLNELIEEYAPNYNKLIQDEELKKQTRTDEGNIWCMSMIDTFAQEAYLGPSYRKDWLDKANLPVPETMDEVYNTLKVFKEDFNATAPLGMAKDGVFTGSHMLISAFGVTNTFFRSGDDIAFGPLEPGYKAYLETMAKWYEEGLIDSEFATKTNLSADITTDKVGMWEDGFWSPNTLKQQSINPEFEMVPGPYPTLKKGEKVTLRQQNYRSQQNNTAVTSSCKNPERAVQWLDFKYSEEGYYLANYGTEGETYTMVDGKPEYTEFFTESKNPKGLDFFNAQYYYLIGKGPFLRQWDREMFSFSDDAYDWMKLWHNSGTGEANIPPYLTMPPAEGEKFSVIMGDINTLVAEKTVVIITGQEPVSNWDKYVEKMKELNIEEAIAIRDAALKRYLAR